MLITLINMDWLTFISSLVASILSLPVILFLIVIVLREPITELLQSLKNLTIDAFGAHINMTTQLDGIREVLNESKQEIERRQETQPDAQTEKQPGTTENVREPESGETQAYESDRDLHEQSYYVLLPQLQSQTPETTVIESWGLVEYELSQLASKTIEDKIYYIRPTLPSLTVVLGELTERNIIPIQLSITIRNLARLSETVVYAPRASVEREQADDYAELAVDTAQILSTYTKRILGDEETIQSELP